MSLPPPPQDSPPPPSDAPTNGKDAKSKPLWKKKRFLIPVGVVLVLVVIGALAADEDADETPVAGPATTSDADTNDADETPATDPSTATDPPTTPDTVAPDETEPETAEECPPTGDDTKTQCLYPGRPDSQPDDHEQLVGGSVRLAGYTTTLNSAEFRPAEGAFGDDCVVIDVTIENRDDSAQSYNTFNWRIQTGGGQVLDAGFCGFTLDSNLGSGDLITGGSVSGTIGFEVEPGSHFVIYKPDAFSASRGIWQVEVE